MGSVKVFIVFIVGGRSFMYIIKSKGPRIDPCGTSDLVYLFTYLFVVYLMMLSVAQTI
jgi:hypothetical protein